MKVESKMKRTMIIIAAMVLGMSAAAQKQNPTYLAYIEQWKETAVQNQADYGIPASIIMAQALLESAAGTSELAVNARNHFGIKCTSEWFGGVYYYDDDSKGECFRQYANAAESFKDHALFLQRPRYATCFEIAIEDYEGWAYRLKACGYATDKNYAPKLIKIIEDYRLDTLGVTGDGLPVTGDSVVERGKVKGESESTKDESTMYEGFTKGRKDESRKRGDGLRVTGDGTALNSGSAALNSAALNSAALNSDQRSHSTATKPVVVHKTEPIAVITRDPEPPYEEPLSAKDEKKLFLLQHPVKKCNGVRYVSAREGDSYANVAFRLNVRERLLREWNDALGREMKTGDRIYMGAKKKKVAPEKTLMWVHPGESLWEVCQREGIQMARVQQLNGFAPEVRVFKTRQQILLNKVKGEN